MISSGSFLLSGLTFVFLISSEFIFVCGVRDFSFHSITCSCLVFPAPLIFCLFIFWLCGAACRIRDRIWAHSSESIQS